MHQTTNNNYRLSHFRARCVRGIRRREAKGKTHVVGMLKRGGEIYTQIVKITLQTNYYALLRVKLIQTQLFIDGVETYDDLVNYGYRRHCQVKHGENEFADGQKHINGIA